MSWCRALCAAAALFHCQRAIAFEWKSAVPQDEGFSAQKLDELENDLAVRRTKALLIIRNDRIVREWYATGHSQSKPHYTASMAKALIGGMALAVAIDDGRIAFDDRVSKFVPQWREDSRKSPITIRQLGSKLAARLSQSPVISRITWASAESIIRRARGSDNWPITWGEDDALYTAYGDGRGFKPLCPKSSAYVLAHVHKNKLREKDAWQFFAGMEKGTPAWRRDIERRELILRNDGICYRAGVSYNTGLGRYLLVHPVRTEISLDDANKPDNRFAGGLAIYDASEPWGPWSRAFYTESWDVCPGKTCSFPTKWMSADGRTMHLVFSGDDCFSVRRAELTTAKQAH
jgi:hypothetical protein